MRSIKLARVLAAAAAAKQPAAVPGGEGVRSSRGHVRGAMRLSLLLSDGPPILSPLNFSLIHGRIGPILSSSVHASLPKPAKRALFTSD